MRMAWASHPKNSTWNNENKMEGEKGHQSVQVVDDTLESDKMDLASIMEGLQTRFLNLSADIVANLAMREMDKWEKKKEDKSKLGELKQEIQKLQSKKRKVSETNQEEEIEGKPILLEETYLLDNAVDKVDLKFQHRLLLLLYIHQPIVLYILMYLSIIILCVLLLPSIYFSSVLYITYILIYFPSVDS